MKRTFLAAIMMFLILSPIGCGHSSSSSPVITAFIMSDPVYDGDISVNAAGTSTIITQGMTLVPPPVQSVFAGINSNGTEFRAFLDFFLDRPGGIVPGNAVIDSAVLDIFIDSIPFQLGNPIPIRIDLVSFQPPTLLDTDFDRPALASITIDIFQSDAGGRVIVDVTSLMQVAQNLALPDFQIRIEDLTAVSPGLIEIDDTTATTIDRANFAPQLRVSYF
jgi:hypothetical protein